MESETTKFLNNLYPYFKMLDNINNDLTKVIRSNKDNDSYQNEELFYNITSELLRLLPYKYNEKDKSIILDNKSGILLLADKIDYIENKYKKILNFDRFHDVLKDIHKIRNKYIHEHHNISYAFSVGGTSICSMGLYYKNQLLSISSVSLAPIVYYLNKVFEMIKNDSVKLIEQDEKYKEYPYYETFINFDFSRKSWNYTILPEYLMLDF